jgi:hypothetical protein
MNHRTLLALALAAVLPLLALSGTVDAKGCVKGAVVGGAVGHVAGKHGVLGAAAGCAIGHHRATVKERDDAARANANSVNSASANATQPTQRSSTATQASAARSY